MLLVKYVPASGVILAVWESTAAALLDAHREPAESGIGYLLSHAGVSAREMAQRWYVVDGVAIPKAVVTLTATPSPFAADGVATCTVSVTPFVPCTLRVDGRDLALTEADQTLVLTAEAPWQFRITVQPTPDIWAAPLFVEAV
jgi:hypothetical protein